MNKKLFCVLILLTTSAIFGQESSEYRLKAAFVERFTRFITWPANSQLKDPVIIGIMGKGEIFIEMKAFFETVKIHNRRVEVRNVIPTSTLTDFDIIFIGSNQQLSIADLKKKISNRPILTIGDSQSMATEGTMFSFNVIGGKLKFIVNSEELQSAGLKVSSILLNSAIIVRTDVVEK